ncbi:MAG: DUF932 domain-containing protein [Phycisphaera sp.]|nr:DUF932 domain-containing protein [Phycisphaera sp.]
MTNRTLHNIEASPLPQIDPGAILRADTEDTAESASRFNAAVTAHFSKSAAEALPEIEYRVTSLRALRPCGNLGEALELRESVDPLDAIETDDDHAGQNGASGARDASRDGRDRTAPDASPDLRPGADLRRKTPKALYLNDEPVVTTPRFWWSLFVRCGLNDAVFRYFDPTEVFDRVARLDAGRSVRFAIEGGGTPGRARRLLAVSAPNGPILDRRDVAEIVDRYGGHRVRYDDGVLSSMHVPAAGDRVISIGPDEYRQRFQLDVPVDGLGEPRMQVALLRLICLNGAIGTRSVFRSMIRIGKDPQHSLERALGHFANDDGFSAMRDRLESAQRSWASLREVRLLERQLDTVSWGGPSGGGLGDMTERRRAFRAMVGDYESRYGLASIDALSVKRQRMLQANCRVYDLINFATEMATHHAPPRAAARLNGWLGSTLTDEYDLENTASEVPEFTDVFMTRKWWRN